MDSDQVYEAEVIRLQRDKIKARIKFGAVILLLMIAATSLLVFVNSVCNFVYHYIGV